MRIRRIVGAVGIISLIVAGFGAISSAQGTATPREVISKVRAAVTFLEKTKGSDLADFDNPKGPWVFGNSYVVVLDCTKGTTATHPFVPKLIGKKCVGLQDVKGNFFFAQLCEQGKKPGGGWVEYWWPKPNQKTPSRKLNYALRVPGTSLVATGSLYSNTLSVADLDKLLSK